MASAIHLWEAEETKSQVDVNFQLFFVILKEIVKTYFFGYLCATYFHLTENYDNENFHCEQCLEFKQGVP